MYSRKIGEGTTTETPRSDTAILLKGEDFTDSSLNNYTITNNNGTTIDAGGKFNSALNFAGVDNRYLTTAYNSNWDLNTDFTMDAWVYINSFTGGKIAGTHIAGVASGGWFWQPTSSGGFLYFNSPSEIFYQVDSPGSLTLNTWHHVAISQVGTTLYMFVDGVLLNTHDTTILSPNRTANSNALVVGGVARANAINYTLDGKIDNFRIVQGQALYTSTFTPPKDLVLEPAPPETTIFEYNASTNPSTAGWTGSGGSFVATTSGYSFSRGPGATSVRISPDTWTFDPTKSYRCTFSIRDPNNNSNYATRVEFGPFVADHFRDGPDRVGMTNTSDGSVTIAVTNAFNTDFPTSGNDVFIIEYDPIDATTGTVTVTENGSLLGSKTITLSTLRYTNPEPHIRLTANSDQIIVFDISMVEIG